MVRADTGFLSMRVGTQEDLDPTAIVMVCTGHAVWCSV